MTAQTEELRCLVACPGCRRQYDAGGLAAGSRFRCACGEIVEVPRFRAQDAAVVRCSSCSAPRARDARSCSHCGADFTLLEQDMRTLCPACMTRVSDRARYCHSCAAPIVPEGRAGTPTREACPACAGRAMLSSRSLGQPPIAVLECPRCAGLWLGSDAFRLLADRARDAVLTEPGALHDSRTAPALATGGGALYRPCPECRKLMNRRNYGQTSGIVLDACKEHGLWFDATELSAVLSWIRKGGEKEAADRRADEERHAEQLKRFQVVLPTGYPDGPGGASGPVQGNGPRSGGGLGDLFRVLFDL